MLAQMLFNNTHCKDYTAARMSAVWISYVITFVELLLQSTHNAQVVLACSHIISLIKLCNEYNIHTTKTAVQIL